MNDNVTLKLYEYGTTTVLNSQNILSFKYERERYTPFSELSVKALADGEIIGEITECEFMVNGILLHKGLVDKCFVSFESGVRTVSLSSKGFSFGLELNEPVPGVNAGVNLERLLNNNMQIPNVDYQTDTEVTNYVYINENTSIWDAVVALCIKSLEKYPYVKSPNKVMFTTDSSTKTITLSDEKIIAYGHGGAYNKLISHVHQCDEFGEYDMYNMENSEATLRNIVRHKQSVRFDKQWLYSIEAGMKFKIDYSNRGMKYRYVKYKGYNGEDIMDSVKCGFLGNSPMEISRVIINGNNEGVKTTLFCYEDSYCNT